MKIKVCGMKDPENIRQLVELPIDMLGLIFYEKSPRFAGGLDPAALKTVPSNIQKAGIFVNAGNDFILDIATRYNLNMLQLHGQESSKTCNELRKEGFKIIKAFPVSDKNDLLKCEEYDNSCDYFLFDTKTSVYGGSGQKFDWTVLSSFRSKTPFLLSGGIDSEDFQSSSLQILKSSNPYLFALDLNSRFEIAPGIKDIEKLKITIQRWKIKKQ
ncbi:MAG: phosphoribosylanthranilate isomerase [Dysgonamonadaceae bacterium]|jgi:phosphoribosylanthranilate isomerase|nr:phosphoribosylanthranilate isomerase [Dysgonamonadaceae bacterium]